MKLFKALVSWEDGNQTTVQSTQKLLPCILRRPVTRGSMPPKNFLPPGKM